MVSVSDERRSGVSYPYAIDRRKRLVRSAEAGSTSGCFCLGCGRGLERMEGGALGHPAGDPVCLPERALCQAARLAVRDGFVAAVEHGDGYLVESTCGDCGRAINRLDMVAAGADLRMEEDGSVLFRRERSLAVVEVYTGRFGGTQSAMFVQDEAVPVYRVEVRDFRCVEELRAGVRASGGVCLDSFCDDCGRTRRARASERVEQVRRRQEERERWLEGRDRKIRESARVKVREIERAESVGLMFVPWFRSRSGAELPLEVQRASFANGVLLTECGFEQHSAVKPWLFRKFLGNGVCAYADLGGSGSGPDGSDSKVGVYVMGMESEEGELRELIRGEVERRLGVAGVDLPERAGFSWNCAVDAVGLDRLGPLVAMGPAEPRPMAGVSVDSISRWRGTQSPERGCGNRS